MILRRPGESVKVQDLLFTGSWCRFHYFSFEFAPWYWCQENSPIPFRSNTQNAICGERTVSHCKIIPWQNEKYVFSTSPFFTCTSQSHQIICLGSLSHFCRALSILGTLVVSLSSTWLEKRTSEVQQNFVEGKIPQILSKLWIKDTRFWSNLRQNQVNSHAKVRVFKKALCSIPSVSSRSSPELLPDHQYVLCQLAVCTSRWNARVNKFF
jgi:hypothetical protein